MVTPYMICAIDFFLVGAKSSCLVIINEEFFLLQKRNSTLKNAYKRAMIKWFQILEK